MDYWQPFLSDTPLSPFLPAAGVVTKTLVGCSNTPDFDHHMPQQQESPSHIFCCPYLAPDLGIPHC